jgi:hypothetical protein
MSALQVVVRRLNRDEYQIRVVNGMDHSYAGCSLEIADHDVNSVSKRLKDVTYCVLIDLWSHDN